MELEPYVLCLWGDRLWPAKVLAQYDRTYRRRKGIGVKILGLEKRVRVPESEMWPLTQDRIDSLSLQLAKDVAPPVEELRYRKALRLALNMFSSGDALPSPSEGFAVPPPWAREAEEDGSDRPGETRRVRHALLPETPGGSSERRRERDLQPARVPAPPRRGCDSAGRRAGAGPGAGHATQSPVQVKSGRRRGRPPKAVAWARIPARRCPHPAPGGNASSAPHRTGPPLCPPGSPGPGPAQRQGVESEAEPSKEETGVPAKPGRGRPRGRRGQRKDGTSDTPPAANRRKRRRVEAGQAIPGPAQSTDSDSQPRPRRRARFEPTEESEGPVEATLSSDLSIELSLQEDSAPLGSSLRLEEGEDESDDEELPSFLLQMEKKPLSIAEGRCVWCKFRSFPFWPALVKSVNYKHKKASVVFIDHLLLDQKRRRKGFSVSLRTLKPFDCEEKDELVVKAREKYDTAFNWCLDLIQDYRIRIGGGTFSGSFMEYFADDISCPVRKMNRVGGAELTFPSKLIEEEEEEEGMVSDDQGVASSTEANRQHRANRQHAKKRLPDRSKAARNRANHKLVHFIVRRRGAEKRLQAVISGQEASRWLRCFLTASRPVVEMYLEDDGQVDQVLAYLEQVFKSAPCVAPCVARCRTQVDDSIRFIMNVLLPEAIIQAIAGVEKLSLQQAEDKYLKGPCISKREREEFDLMIEKQMRTKEQEECS
ncbi:hypothetical protein AAFF_G00298060 [Aldrovandia affinis]|uniref:PWWP domain-containing protein n=1 Tax=Aldrovandia affinis TaxID=143900 RepID=A0AAD7R8Q1_9TELE|nr:hypothetical protein AAFF_G00298060 [Aldrovandia affinis]